MTKRTILWVEYNLTVSDVAKVIVPAKDDTIEANGHRYKRISGSWGIQPTTTIKASCGRTPALAPSVGFPIGAGVRDTLGGANEVKAIRGGDEDADVCIHIEAEDLGPVDEGGDVPIEGI